MTKNVVSAKGARLLRKVAKHILAEPRRYEQNTIIYKGMPGERFSGRLVPECGTVACIGGWIEILAGMTSSEFGLDFEAGQRLLGVSHDQYGSLVQYTTNDLSDHQWPKRFSSAYNKAKTPRTKARIANERIEHFIKTGE